MKKSYLFLMGQLCLFGSLMQAGWAQNQPQTSATEKAESQGSLSGVLTDSITGKPIGFATVALLQEGGTQAVDGTLTDDSGRFSFASVPTGDYALTFSFIGYKTKTIRAISVSEREPGKVLGTIRLAPAVTQLQEVNVQMLRPTITQEADRMVVNVEGTALAAGSTAYDVLAKSPGVYIDQ